MSKRFFGRSLTACARMWTACYRACRHCHAACKRRAPCRASRCAVSWALWARNVSSIAIVSTAYASRQHASGVRNKQRPQMAQRGTYAAGHGAKVRNSLRLATGSSILPATPLLLVLNAEIRMRPPPQPLNACNAHDTVGDHAVHANLRLT